MKLPPPVIFAINQAVNKVLALDIDRVDKLSALSGKVVRVEIVGLDAELNIIFLEESVEVSSYFDGEVDTVLSGTPISLLSLAKDNNALFNGSVSMHGDSATGKDLKKFMVSLDVDWEDQLSTITGDGIAHKIFRLGDGFRSMLSGNLSKLARDTGDYFQEESLSLAPNSEVRRFALEVDELRTDVDRLEAHISYLEKHLDVATGGKAGDV